MQDLAHPSRTKDVALNLTAAIGLILALLIGSSGKAEETNAPENTEKKSTEWIVNYHSAGNRPGAVSFGESLREGPMGGIWQRTELLGDMFGFRSLLARNGMSLSLQETSEYLGNLTGGVKKGFAFDGLTTIDFQLNTLKAFRWHDGLFNVSALEVHGHNLSQTNLGPPLQTVSGIEAENGFRLWELWYQQGFWYRQMSLRVGAQSLDQEFIVSQYAGLFANTMFGWPMVPSADMLGGGPAYPLASLGLRVKTQPMGSPWAFLAGFYDDNPSGIDPTVSDNPQRLNGHGTNLRLKDSGLLIAEVQYSRPAVGELEYPEDQGGILPGTYKLGFWYDFGKFADQQVDTNGASLQDPNSSGVAGIHQSNYSLYAVVDQLIWRKSSDSPQGVGVFTRVMGAPAAQNQISFSANAGITWRAPIRHREYDVVGLGFGYARVSDRLASSDRDFNSFNNASNPVRSSETMLELTYQYQLVPWWQLQPDIQYIFNPGGGLADPDDSSGQKRIADEFIIGLRTNITL